MGDEAQPQAAPPPPQAPNYAAANREAVQADIDTLDTRRRIDAAARLGKVVYDPDTGQTYDFTGLGDAEIAKQQALVNAETAGITAESMLQLQQKYGKAFADEALKRLEEADPSGFKARRKLADTVLSDLELGSSLTPEEEATVEQYMRGAQSARGNALGNAASAKEVFAKTEFGQKLKQQRLSNVSSYVLSSPLTAQYQTLQGAQQGAAPYTPTAYAPGVGINPNAGLSGAQFASNIYGSQMSGYGSGLGYSANVYNTQANQPNPWLEGLGIAVKAGTTLGAAAMM